MKAGKKELSRAESKVKKRKLENGKGC